MQNKKKRLFGPGRYLKYGEETRPVTFRLPKSLLQDIKKIAEKEGKPSNEVAYEFLKEKVEEEKKRVASEKAKTILFSILLIFIFSLLVFSLYFLPKDIITANIEIMTIIFVISILIILWKGLKEIK
jgi:hypothetical protein